MTSVFHNSLELPEVIFKRQFFSKDSASKLFTTQKQGEGENEEEKILLDAENVLQFYQQNSQLHMIPMFDNAVTDRVRHL